MMMAMWLLLAGAGLVLYFVIHNKQMSNQATPTAALPPVPSTGPANSTSPAAGKPSANIMDYEWMGALDAAGAEVTGVIANFAPASSPFGGGGSSGSGGDGSDMSGVGMGAAPSSGGLAESPAPPYVEVPPYVVPSSTPSTPPVTDDGVSVPAPGSDLPPVGTTVNAVVIRRSEIAKIMTKYGAGSDPFAAMGEVFDAMSKGIRVRGRVYGYGKGLAKAFGTAAAKSDTFTIVEVTQTAPGGPAVGSYVAVG